MEQLLRDGLASLGLPGEGVPALLRYAEALVETNKVMNLTAITDPEQVARLHFLDSAALLGCAGDLSGMTLIDVGTGAGFPGMALKLLCPELKLTLLDSLAKRLDWLAAVCSRLGLEDVEIVHARAEEQGLKPGFRDHFDFATARAVADLRVLCELCLPFVRVGGRFLAMKAADSQEELDAARTAIQTLGGRRLEDYTYTIPGTDVIRRVAVIEKTAPTPKPYPRRWAKIQKAPL